MKKTFKRAGIAVLSMSMLLSMGAMTAISSNAAVGKILINNTNNSIPDGTALSVYKVATYNTTSSQWQWCGSLSNANTGASLVSLAEESDNSATVKSVAKNIQSLIVGGKSGLTEMTGDQVSGTAFDVDSGKNWYMVIPAVGGNQVAQPILIGTNDDETATISSPKMANIPFTKSIIDVKENGVSVKNDNVDTNGDNASVRGDSVVTYLIAGMIPTYDTSVTKAMIKDYTISDEATGLVIDKDTIHVYLSDNETYESATDTEFSSGDVTINEMTSDANKFSVVVPGTTIGQNGVTGCIQGKYVLVKFDARLATTHTNVGQVTTHDEAEGNDNTATLTYGNNFLTGQGNGTATDDADVYTVNLTIYKLDTDNSPLTGAEFTLTGDNGFNSGAVSGTGTNSNEFVFANLDVGTYTLTETTVPPGHKQAGPWTITVSDANKDNRYSITSSGLTINNPANATSGFTTNVVNQMKDTLPGTGGMGTILFTVGGAAVVLLAGALFVVYMRKRKVEE